MNYTPQFLESLQSAKENGFNVLTHVIALAFVAGKPHGATMTDVAAACGVSTAAITTAVDVIEKMGLVKRERTIEDRRSIRLRITNAGRETLNLITKP
jgi:DNA-binding MarR family transcriptional regulator